MDEAGRASGIRERNRRGVDGTVSFFDEDKLQRTNDMNESATPTTWNIARRLEQAAARHPFKRALVFPQSRDAAGNVAYTHLTFQQLAALSDRYAHGLQALGLGRGDTVLLMVRMSLDFTALTFALFKLGAAPVMIDPGMGVRGFLRCVRHVRPRGFIGIPQAHVLRLLCRRTFKSVRVPVTLGPRWFWGGAELADFADRGVPFPAVGMAADELAAILFTSGSTGPAKGVEYTHRILETQVDILQKDFAITADQVDLPCFPLFGLFSTGLGCTAIIPEMDPTRPASVDPARIVEAINDHGVTYSFGSPALWRTVGRHCAKTGIRFPTLKRIYMSGAPVPADLHRLLLDHALPEGANTFTPYGATEALPVSCFDGREMLSDTAHLSDAGAGICVGRPVQDATVRIIAITDEAIENWDDAQVLPDGQIGEIVVCGPMVTRAYYGLDAATRLAKIHAGETIWHRIGDLGYFDREGRLWMCGRKNHRVETARGMMCTVCCEAIVNLHPRVARSALVGVGADRYRQTPVIVVEPEPAQFPENEAAAERLRQEVLALTAANERTRVIERVLLHSAFPVDIRHNAKINREELARFAAEKAR